MDLKSSMVLTSYTYTVGADMEAYLIGIRQLRLGTSSIHQSRRLPAHGLDKALNLLNTLREQPHLKVMVFMPSMETTRLSLPTLRMANSNPSIHARVACIQTK